MVETDFRCPKLRLTGVAGLGAANDLRLAIEVRPKIYGNVQANVERVALSLKAGRHPSGASATGGLDRA